MNVIFLDIDYVLNSSEFDSNIENYRPYYSEIDPKCLARLAYIVHKIKDVKIVISSDWRYNLEVKDFKEIFDSFKFDSSFTFDAEIIIDKTSADIAKAKSIEKYLIENKVKNFVIIDDDKLFEENNKLSEYQYQTTHRGLLDKDIDRVVQLYNKINGEKNE